MPKYSELPPHLTNLPKQYDVYPFVDPNRFKGKLQGKVVLIPGASVGIGKACAHAFASAGASVVCVARRQALLDELVQDLKTKYQVPAHAIAVDLLDNPSDTAKRLVKETETTFGPVDILINNAGICRMGKFAEEKNFSEWWNAIRLNVEVPAALVHAVLPSMLERKTGTLIELASSAGAHEQPQTFYSSYSTSKAAMIKFNRVLHYELIGTGISSFAFHPGNVWTDMVAGSMQYITEHHPEIFEEMKERNSEWLTVKWQTVELAAGTVLALAADERCKVLSGLYIDGEQDLEEIIKAAESGKVEDERLYRLKVEEL